MKRISILLLLLFTLVACKPANPSVPQAGGAGRGYRLLLQVFDRHGGPVARKAECTIVAYSAPDRVVTVDGKPYNNHYEITIGGSGYRLNIIDTAEAVTIEWICTMTGRPGDEFLCTVNKMGGGPANFIGEPNVRDLVAGDDNVAMCSGTINARS